MDGYLLLVFSFALGAAIGSFLNVCICRIPERVSVVSPPSACPGCATPIRAFDNIPIISYFLLRGRCRACGVRISARYPAVEALTGAAAAVLFFRFGLSVETFVYFAFTCALIVITFIDLAHRIIPDVISLPGIVAGMGASFFLVEPGVFSSVIGALLGGGLLFAVAEGYYRATGREGMGGGDVKLLAMIGALLGWKGVIVTLMAASVIGSAVGIAVMVAQGKDGRYAIPFGPFLAAGALVHLFSGKALIGWYLARATGL